MNQGTEMFVDPTTGSDWNSGLSPDQPLCTIQAAMDKIPFLHEQHRRTAKYGTGAIIVLPGQPPKEKKQLEEWPPEADNLNEEWWK